MKSSWRSRNWNTTLISIAKTARMLPTRYTQLLTCHTLSPAAGIHVHNLKFYYYEISQLFLSLLPLSTRCHGCWKNMTGSTRSASSLASPTPRTTSRQTIHARPASVWRSWRRPPPSWRGTSTRGQWTCWMKQKKGWGQWSECGGGLEVKATSIPPCLSLCSITTWWRRRGLLKTTKQKSCRPSRSWTRKRMRLSTWRGRRSASLLHNHFNPFVFSLFYAYRM